MLFPPPWFSPLDPPFRGAPFFKEFRQGGKPIPPTRGARSGAAKPGGNSTAFVSFEIGRPTGARRHSAAQPPSRLPPPGAGRVGQAGSGSSRSVPHTLPAFRGRRHGERALKTKPAPRVAGCVDEQGNPRTRFPWPAASSLWPRAPRRRRTSSRSAASSVRLSPFPRSCHESCGDNFRASTPDALRASTIADVDTAVAPGSGSKTGNQPLRPQTWKTTRYVRPGRTITKRRGC